MVISRDLVQQLLTHLSARDKAVVELLYYGGCTQAEVGRLLGYSESWVSLTLHHRILPRLRAIARQQRLC